MFKITLADGAIVENINVNGSTLVSYKPIDPSIFENNLSPVIFEWEGEIPSDDRNSFITIMNGTHEHMEFYDIGTVVEGEYWFALTDVPESEIRYAQLRSNIDYIAMMTDVEL